MKVLIIIFAVLVYLFFLFLYLKNVSNRHFASNIEKYANQFKSFLGQLDFLGKDYITHKSEEEFLQNWKYLYDELKPHKLSEKNQYYEEFNKIKEIYSNFHNVVIDLNERFIKQTSDKYNFLLSNIDAKSLDEQQRKVVISDEDNTLVLAGAGSGKTLTIAAKVKYLCQIKGINPRDILLISFTNKSAEEMTERIQKKLGIPIEAMTFHKLGLEIIKNDDGRRPEVYDNLEAYIHTFFDEEILKHQDLVKSLTEYFMYYLDIPHDIEKYESIGEYYETEKSADLETLKSKYDKEKYLEQIRADNSKVLKTFNGEKVKSLEETKIANFLFMNGINYEYEKEYPFESEDSLRKKYRPDFYLPDYDIYIEHFGITKDYKCPWLSPEQEKQYVDGIKWKREFHKKNGTKLLETYSYYTKDGILLSKLEELLRHNNVKFEPRDFTDIFNTIYAKKSNKYFNEFITLCCTFIILFKSNNYKEDMFEKMKKDAREQKSVFIYERTRLFLEIVKILYREYQDFLNVNKAIDFSDMINIAAEKVQNGAKINRYKYIIVDEYQDISQARFNLLKSIVDATNAKILCVGDDWQSIYRFAGSDISLFTRFEEYFGYTNLLKIEKTYRNSQELIDQASLFISKNPLQLQKKLTSERHIEYPLVFWRDDDLSKALELSVQKIIKDFGKEKSILLLGRTSFDQEVIKNSKQFRIIKERSRTKVEYIPSLQTPITFLTVHKSKGLEADNVVLLNFKNDKMGFPNQIADDKVLNLVLTKDEDYPFAEERRLFYVAITRTKNRTFILTPNKKPSIFEREFTKSNSVCFVSMRKE